ncbi:MAG: methyltransferase [Candidatus Latescibacteria bacterium]|nr:methyltransferase [Candidatus Latescibacterota bacterium]
MPPSVARHLDGARVIDLGYGGHCALPGLAGVAQTACFVTTDIRRLRSCEAWIREAQVSGFSAVLADSLTELPKEPFDVALFQPEGWAAKEWVCEQIDQAFMLLTVGGRLYLSGRRDKGIESYRKRLEAVFRGADREATDAGLRTYVAEKTGDKPGADPVDTGYAFDVSGVPGSPYRFRARAGVFSRDGLDPGTRLLLETPSVRPCDRVLDLGSGYGAIGIVAARQASDGEVAMVDVDLRAVRSAEANIQLNGISNARAALSDGFEAVREEAFDLILSNPPTHEGKRAAEVFVTGAAAHLAPGGRFQVVTMRPNLYSWWMKRCLDEAETLEERDGYTVLLARSLR